MKKRLTRSSSDRVLTGLLGGIAQYFGVDSRLVRIIFVILSLSGINFPFVILYFVASLFIPLDTDSR